MIDVNINIESVNNFVSHDSINAYEERLNSLARNLLNKSGEGAEVTGWVDLPENAGSDYINNILETANDLKKKGSIFIVVGIGGSYLGARAVIDALSGSLGHYLGEADRDNPTILYAGHHMGEDYLNDLLKVLDHKDYTMAVISKSGTTTEPAIAFRILRNHMEQKYGKEEARERIVAITDKEKGALKKLSDNEGFKTLEIPPDIGGRFSVLTNVGLLPIAMAGYDIKQLLEGARVMRQSLINSHSMADNPAFRYAAARNALLKSGKTTEILAGYTPKLHYFIEWWKQLFGESEGKDSNGIFPTGVNFTTDLHSMGQYIQDGLRVMFETVITINEPENTLEIPYDQEDLDGLNFLAGKRLQYVNQMAQKGTTLAHIDGGVPNIIINIPRLNEYTLGELIYFFEYSCALSGYILGVNPFNQPGVEAYKKNMFALLGKPGFEKETERLKARF